MALKNFFLIYKRNLPFCSLSHRTSSDHNLNRGWDQGLAIFFGIWDGGHACELQHHFQTFSNDVISLSSSFWVAEYCTELSTTVKGTVMAWRLMPTGRWQYKSFRPKHHNSTTLKRSWGCCSLSPAHTHCCDWLIVLHSTHVVLHLRDGQPSLPLNLPCTRQHKSHLPNLAESQHHHCFPRKCSNHCSATG